jgi:hypothetical protein
MTGKVVAQHYCMVKPPPAEPGYTSSQQWSKGQGQSKRVCRSEDYNKEQVSRNEYNKQQSSNIKQKRGGGKCCSPVLFHSKITTRRARRPSNTIMWTDGQGKIQGRKGMRTMNKSVTLKIRGRMQSLDTKPR